MSFRKTNTSANSQKSQTVFFAELEAFCTRYLVIRPQALTNEEQQQFPQRLNDIQQSLFEHLLLFDTMSFKVHDKNLPLLILLKTLGESGVEALIDQGALRFVHWTPLIMFGVQDIPGVNALMTGSQDSSPFNDPEASIELGLRQQKEPPSKSTIKRLVRKIVPFCEVTPPSLAVTAVEVANSAYNSGKLSPLGLSPEKAPLDDMQKADREKFCRYATSLLEYRFLIEHEMTSLSNFEYFSFFQDSTQKLAVTSGMGEKFERLVKLEGFPDLKAIYQGMDKPLMHLPKLRDTRSSRKFRHWLAAASENNVDITAEYLKTFVEANERFNSKGGKLTKAILMMAVGTGLGHLVHIEVSGAAIGAMAGAVAEPATEFALDILDKYFFEEWQKGWSPRMFFDDLKKISRTEQQEKAGKNDSV